MNNIPPEEYEQILEKMPVVCVDLIIHKDGKVLMVKRSNEPAKGQLWIPGGRVFKNERLDTAVHRKALEEVGIDVVIERKINAYDEFFEKGPFPGLKTGVHTISVCYLCRPKDDSPGVRVDGQSVGFAWISELTEEMHPYLKKVIKDAKVF
ncbi:MAG: NUDIX domain-containing protein [Nanoarchaeota archaeon]